MIDIWHTRLMKIYKQAYLVLEYIYIYMCVCVCVCVSMFD